MKTGRHAAKKGTGKAGPRIGAAAAAVLVLLLLCLTLPGGGKLCFRALDRIGLCSHDWQEGICRKCGKVCAHGEWTEGRCSLCGLPCSHSFISDGDGGEPVCAVCGTVCSHRWEEGTCTLCGKSCSHRWEEGRCGICGTECAHCFCCGVCERCGLICSHAWEEGVCTICGTACAHSSHDPETRRCAVCGAVCAHECVKGVCLRCGKDLPFTEALLPEEIFTVSEAGTLYEAGYTTRNYAFEEQSGTASEPIEKTMVVYLPAGYDPEKQYNVLFLLHGNYGWIYDWLGVEYSFRDRQLRGKDLLDGMIEQGYCDPLIVISPTFYTDTAESGTVYSDFQFSREMVRDILPAVARYFGTYAESDSPEALAASRDHFGIAGLSDGALFTLRLEAYAPEYFAWFGCFSGNNGTKDVAEALNGSGLEIGYFITGAGADDGQRRNVENEFLWIQEETDRIRDGENAACIIVENCGHSWNCWYTMLYNTLLAFFH